MNRVFIVKLGQISDSLSRQAVLNDFELFEILLGIKLTRRSRQIQIQYSTNTFASVDLDISDCLTARYIDRYKTRIALLRRIHRLSVSHITRIRGSKCLNI